MKKFRVYPSQGLEYITIKAEECFVSEANTLVFRVGEEIVAEFFIWYGYVVQ